MAVSYALPELVATTQQIQLADGKTYAIKKMTLSAEARIRRGNPDINFMGDDESSFSLEGIVELLQRMFKVPECLALVFHSMLSPEVRDLTTPEALMELVLFEKRHDLYNKVSGAIIESLPLSQEARKNVLGKIAGGGRDDDTGS